MKIFYLLILTSVLICCDEEVLDVNSLKDSGYREIYCKDIEEYENKETRFIEFNKKLLDRKDFLVARCFDNNNCFISMFKNKDKVICQRYIIDKSVEDKRDYFSIDAEYFTIHRTQYLSAEYDKHKVFYLDLNK